MNRVFQIVGTQPCLNTSRLHLRAFLREDAARVCDLVGDWHVARMMAPVPFPYSRREAEVWISSHEENARNGIDLTYAIQRNSSLIGSINVENRGDNTVGIGYWIGRPFWGAGYATEAVHEVLRFAFEDLDQAELTTSLFADNTGSARVLEKAGFLFSHEEQGWSEARRQICRKHAYHLTRTDWQAQKRPL